MRECIACFSPYSFYLCSQRATKPVEPFWEEAWLDRAGQPVSAKVVTSYEGAEHCDWQSATFLSLGWPLGKKMKSIDEGRQYVRDPDGVIGGWGVRRPVQRRRSSARAREVHGVSPR